MTLYRALKEGEVILEADLQIYDEKMGSVWARYVGEKYKDNINFKLFRPVKTPTFEEVFDSVDIECVYKRHECKYNNDCKLHIYKETLKLTGLTGDNCE